MKRLLHSLDLARWMVVIATIVAGGWVLALAAIGLLSVMEPPPVRYLNIPFPTNNPVQAGGPLGTQIVRCNDSDRRVITSISRRIVNLETGEVYLMPPGAGTADPGCSQTVGDLIVPPSAPPGEYQARFVVRVAGRWRNFEIDQWTQSFTVVAPGETSDD